jgi:monomeric sarcosine oxidase
VGERRDLVVIGAGLMGAAAAWSASRRGLSVTVLEQFEPGHVHGGSHGSARIVRRAYGDALYTRLTGRAFELWRELELDSGASVIRMLGGLDFGRDRNVAAVAGHLADAGVPHEALPPDEAQRRWPGMRFDGEVVYHPQAGTLDAARAVVAFLDGAARRGAAVQSSRAVRSIEPAGEDARVELSDGSLLSATHVVVAAGGWVGPLLHGVVDLPPLTVTEQPVLHFPRLDPADPPWPSVIHQDDAGGAHGIYHLAGGRDGGPADDRKIGEHEIGTRVDPRTRNGIVDPAARERMIEYVRRWLPGLDPTPRTESTCLYTSTPSEDFVLDRAGPLVVASPCSGHGAKFAPLIGELCTDLVLGTAEVPDRFRLARHAVAASGKVSL